MVPVTGTNYSSHYRLGPDYIKILRILSTSEIPRGNRGSTVGRKSTKIGRRDFIDVYPGSGVQQRGLPGFDYPFGSGILPDEVIREVEPFSFSCSILYRMEYSVSGGN